MGSTNFVDLAKVPKLGTKSNIQASAAEIALLRSAKVFPYIQ